MAVIKETKEAGLGALKANIAIKIAAIRLMIPKIKKIIKHLPQKTKKCENIRLYKENSTFCPHCQELIKKSLPQFRTPHSAFMKKPLGRLFLCNFPPKSVPFIINYKILAKISKKVAVKTWQSKKVCYNVIINNLGYFGQKRKNRYVKYDGLWQRGIYRRGLGAYRRN